MNVVRSTVPSLLLSLLSVCTMASPEPLCVIRPSRMPRSWQPSPELETTLSAARWSADEAKDAEYAVQRGLDELTDYFSRRPSTVMHLGEDAVEPFLDATYSAANMLTLQVAARDARRRAQRERRGRAWGHVGRLRAHEVTQGPRVDSVHRRLVTRRARTRGPRRGR